MRVYVCRVRGGISPLQTARRSASPLHSNLENITVGGKNKQIKGYWRARSPGQTGYVVDFCISDKWSRFSNRFRNCNQIKIGTEQKVSGTRGISVCNNFTPQFWCSRSRYEKLISTVVDAIAWEINLAAWPSCEIAVGCNQVSQTERLKGCKWKE